MPLKVTTQNKNKQASGKPCGQMKFLCALPAVAFLPAKSRQAGAKEGFY